MTGWNLVLGCRSRNPGQTQAGAKCKRISQGWRTSLGGEKGGRERTWAERRDRAESGGGWGREPVGGWIMARLLRALRGLPLLEVSGRPVRGCAGSGRGDSGRSSVAAAAS